jgi:hypothetical protein
MTDPRRDGPFEVPVVRLARGRRDGRRAAIVAISIVVVVGGAFGLARWSAGNAAAPPTPAARSVAPVAVGSAVPSTRPRRSAEPRIERLLDVPDRAVTGAPHLTIVERHGRDLRVLEWTPGAGLAELRSLPGAITGSDDTTLPVMAPVGDRMVLLTLGRPGDAGDSARLIDGSGRTVWTGDENRFPSGAVWSRDGRLVAMAATGRTWHLVAIDDAGTARDRVVNLPPEVFLPSPTPIGSLTIPRLTPRTVPLGFSADGRWIYGGVVSPELGTFTGEFRVAVDGHVVEPVRDFGVGRADGLLPLPGTMGGRLVDPAAGRIASWRVNADTTGGPPTLEIRNPDAGAAFVVDVATPLGSGWDADGSLYVLSSDSLLYADSATLARIGPDGTAEPPLLATGPITSAGLLGIRDGFAAVAMWTTKPASAAQIVLVDLADPTRISALPVTVGGARNIISAELAR